MPAAESIDVLPFDAASAVTPRQAILIDLLAIGTPIVRAAEQGGVSRRTVYNWLENGAFRTALDARRRELADRVTELGQVAITALIDVLQADGETLGYEKKARAELAERLLVGMGLLAGKKPAGRD
jgi:hypothetical protein